MENLYQVPSASWSASERRAFWTKAIVAQSTGGLSLVKFCQLHGLKFSTFKGYKYGRRKAICHTNDNNGKRIRKNKDIAKFIPLQIAADVSTNKYPENEGADSGAEIKVILKNGHKLILPPSITEASLLSIIKVVSELQC